MNTCIGLDNVLASNMRQVIIRNNYGIVYRRIYALLGFNELNILPLESEQGEKYRLYGSVT